jgi:hypothetical protein
MSATCGIILGLIRSIICFEMVVYKQFLRIENARKMNVSSASDEISSKTFDTGHSPGAIRDVPSTDHESFTESKQMSFNSAEKNMKQVMANNKPEKSGEHLGDRAATEDFVVGKRPLENRQTQI